MNNNNASGGFPLFGILGIVFIILKLTNVVAWSWLWVLAPFWLPVLIVLPIAIIVLLVAAAAATR